MKVAARRPLASRLVMRSVELSGTVAMSVRALTDGLLLGVVSERTLEQVDISYYERDIMYRDDAYNTSGLRWWEEAAIADWFPPTGHVIVTGAGGGREVLALDALGYSVSGYEPNPVLVDEGQRLVREHCGRSTLELSPRDRFPSCHCVDAVVVGWGSYMLIGSRAKRIDYLRDARRSAMPGAPMLVSFFARPRASPYHRIVARTANAIRRRRHMPAIEVGDGLAPNRVHSFTREELSQELKVAGWRLVHWSIEDYGHAVAFAGSRDGADD